MLENFAVAFAIIVAVVVTIKAFFDVRAAHKVLDEDDADQAPYKIETPMEEYPVEEADSSVSAPAEPIPSLQEPVAKPKRKRRKKTTT